MSKLKLKASDVIVESETIITVHPNKSKNSRRLNFALSELKEQIPNVVVKVCIFILEYLLPCHYCERGVVDYRA